jgi:hypothetical protein
MTIASFDMTLPRAWARVAGVCWVIAIVGGMFAEAFVRNKLRRPSRRSG